MSWLPGASEGRVAAADAGKGSKIYQLNKPTDVVFDRYEDTHVVCDRENRRVMRWTRRNPTFAGVYTASHAFCYGLALDKDRFLYVTDQDKQDVRRYRIGESKSTLVAGGNGKGDRYNQFNNPSYIFVDKDYSVYVSDTDNHRVMKWLKGATEGFVVAGGKTRGAGANQLAFPKGIFVDSLGTVCVADGGNHRVMRWQNGADAGKLIVGGNGAGQRANQLNSPEGLSFDHLSNLYIADSLNHRVQKYLIESD